MTIVVIFCLQSYEVSFHCQRPMRRGQTNAIKHKRSTCKSRIFVKTASTELNERTQGRKVTYWIDHVSHNRPISNWLHKIIKSQMSCHVIVRFCNSWKWNSDYIYPSFLDPPDDLVFTDQFAFRPTASTTAALISLLHNISTMLATNKYVIVYALSPFPTFAN
jgi:hypothetical protein